MSAPRDSGDAVEQLWRELSGSLHRWFVTRTGDPHAADDLLQECFLRLHDRISSVREDERLAGWMQQVARNLLTDWRRQRRPAELDAEPLASTDEPEGVDAVVASWLAPTIEALDDVDRETLRLTELEGVAQSAAASRLGVSLPALKSRVLRGRARLRERVLACCELEFDRRGGVVSYRERASRCGDDACE